MSEALTSVGRGVWMLPGARIIDRSGCKRLAIGDAEFISAMKTGTLVDKTMLIADVLDSGYKATLFCRPRRFGKTLNMTMLKAFLEMPSAGGLSHEDAEAIFAGTEIWDADGGSHMSHQGEYPVIHISLGTAKKLTWSDEIAELRGIVQTEYLRHSYLRGKDTPLAPEDLAYFDAIAGNVADDTDFARSLAALARMLYAYHGTGSVILIDEYDAPVMSGHSNGYYDVVVNFLKGWLTGALKDGGMSVAFSCLTGVQRISKESIFSDLNNLYISTSLMDDFDERYGFTEAEVAALATYLGHPDCLPEAHDWYDGYRFGSRDVYNPWSVTCYLNAGCKADVYWGNTSGNSVVGELVARADAETLEDVYALLEPGGTVERPLDLGVVFPELGVRPGALWSMLYLAGYLTTEDTRRPNSRRVRRRLRVPNREIRELFLDEVIERFTNVAGGLDRLDALHKSLVAGDGTILSEELGCIARSSMSYLDLTSELPCHALLMGLLFGMTGYHDPMSNREAGYGRYDIRLEPNADIHVGRSRPLITIEVKYLKTTDATGDYEGLEVCLRELANKALEQIRERCYDVDLPDGVVGRLRWGIAFCGKRVVAVSEWA